MAIVFVNMIGRGCGVKKITHPCSGKSQVSQLFPLLLGLGLLQNLVRHVQFAELDCQFKFVVQILSNFQRFLLQSLRLEELSNACELVFGNPGEDLGCLFVVLVENGSLVGDDRCLATNQKIIILIIINNYIFCGYVQCVANDVHSLVCEVNAVVLGDVAQEIHVPCTKLDMHRMFCVFPDLILCIPV
jgi:hypothetical protein